MGLGAALSRLLASALALLRDASGASLALTGVLGLAVALYAFHVARGGSAGRKHDEGSEREPPRNPGLPPASAAAAAAQAVGAPAAAVARRLAGIRRVTLSVPGVMLEEGGAEELEESASVRAGAAALVREIARTTDLYLMCHVCDDVGEAVVRGALEHAGVTGSKLGQVPAHRLLFCGTLAGKVSIVRQLEPELHIDGHPQTVSDLQRFVKQLILVDRQQQVAASNVGLAGPTAGNVQHAASLAAALGLPR